MTASQNDATPCSSPTRSPRLWSVQVPARTAIRTPIGTPKTIANTIAAIASRSVANEREATNDRIGTWNWVDVPK